MGWSLRQTRGDSLPSTAAGVWPVLVSCAGSVVAAGLRLRSVTVDDVEDCFTEIHVGRDPIIELTNGCRTAQILPAPEKHRPHQIDLPRHFYVVCHGFPRWSLKRPQLRARLRSARAARRPPRPRMCLR